MVRCHRRRKSQFHQRLEIYILINAGGILQKRSASSVLMSCFVYWAVVFFALLIGAGWGLALFPFVRLGFSHPLVS
jgi:hypothetical protein